MNIIGKMSNYLRLVMRERIKLNSELLGADITPSQYMVAFRDISNFAASIGDENPAYYSHKAQSGIVGHPVLPVKWSWQVICALPQKSTVAIPDGLLENMLHQSEHLILHRPVRPGDELRVSGKWVGLRPHKMGVKVGLRFDYWDSRAQPVVTEYVGGIILGAHYMDGKNVLEFPPVIEQPDSNEVLWQREIPVSRLTCYHYDGCNDIVYPIHTDIKRAREQGLPDIILQGTATLAMCTSMLIESCAGKNPARVAAVAGKFTDILVPPNMLTVRVYKQTAHEVFFDSVEQNGKYVLRDGYLRIRND